MVQVIFTEILDAAVLLPLEDQETLIQILKNHLLSQKQTELVKDIMEK